MQHETTTPLPLLDAQGQLVRPGWARQPHWRYDRAAIQAPRWRIKEWDYYSLFGDEGRFALTLTLADLGYLGLAAACFIDMEAKFFHQVDALIPFPMGRLGLGSDSDCGRVHWHNRDISLDFDYRPGARHLRFHASRLRNAQGHEGMEGEVVLHQETALQSMNIATSWRENPQAFYYNRKINNLAAEGHMRIGGSAYAWNPTRDFGALDWGRGHWTYRNRWYWGSASGWHEGHRLGWNIGYGFTDRTPASENTLFWDGVVHKLADVEFQYNPRNYLEAWRFSSSDGRFEMDFSPALDRKSHTHLGLIRSEQHQVFGHYSGRVVLDDGRVVHVARMAGFAEDVLNWW